MYITDARTTVVLIDEIAEVGAQHPAAHWLLVLQVEIALLIDVFKLRMPDSDQGALLVEAVLATGVVERIGGHPRRGPGREVLHVRGVTQAH